MNGPLEVRDVDRALIAHAERSPSAVALVDAGRSITYAELNAEIDSIARTLAELGVCAGDRVAVVAAKRVETVSALLGTMRLGAIGVPFNPLLKADQIRHVLTDSGARLLIGPRATVEVLAPAVSACPALRDTVAAEDLVVTACDDGADRTATGAGDSLASEIGGDDVAALMLYTSGSTARPKGVVLSRSNLAHGAASVATYLENGPEDRILAMMPLSFDYGLNQILTALRVGARAILFDYLVPKGVVNAVVRHRITGLPAVPHLWNKLARLDWPPVEHLRYVTNTGGRMPVETTRALARALPRTRVVLMYGFTEAFRSTWLPPDEVHRRPDSIGRAVPHAEVLVVDERGNECAPGETGELIHGGPLVALGYWQDEAATRAKFRPRFRDGRAVSVHARATEPYESDGSAPRAALFAWSGDLVRRDEAGYLYFVSRREDVAKLHGFRVNPAEIEEAIARSTSVREVAVVCVPHPSLGQAAVAVLVTADDDIDAIERHCRDALPRFMRPERIVTVRALPTSPNSKIDRQALLETYGGIFSESPDRDGDVS